MILINFSHPLTEENKLQIEAITQQQITKTIDHLASLDNQSPFVPQVHELLEKISLTSTQWQTEQILIVLPTLNFITAVMLAELQGRMGYLPTIIRLREVVNVLPRKWEVAEIIDLHSIRTEVRNERKS
jgi:hypothetical protein